MTVPRRLVFDTNVVISALVFGGSAAVIRSAWQARTAIPLVDRFTAQELLRVLSYPKFQLSASERTELLAGYLPWCEVTAIPRKRPAAPSCRDPDDQKFLELALAGKADGIVTGDKDILALAPIFPINILTVETFCKLIK